MLKNEIKIANNFKYGCKVNKNTSMFIKHIPDQPLIRRRNYRNQASDTCLELEYLGLRLKQLLHMKLKRGLPQHQTSPNDFKYLFLFIIKLITQYKELPRITKVIKVG